MQIFSNTFTKLVEVSSAITFITLQLVPLINSNATQQCEDAYFQLLIHIFTLDLLVLTSASFVEIFFLATLCTANPNCSVSCRYLYRLLHWRNQGESSQNTEFLMSLTKCDVQGCFRSSSLVFNVQRSLEYLTLTVGIFMLKTKLQYSSF